MLIIWKHWQTQLLLCKSLLAHFGRRTGCLLFSACNSECVWATNYWCRGRITWVQERLSSVESSQASPATENDSLKENVAYLAEYTHCGDTRKCGGLTSIRIHLKNLVPKPADGDNRPRPFIVKLHHFQIKELILRLTREKGRFSDNRPRIHIFPYYSPDVNKWHAAFSEKKRKQKEAPHHKDPVQPLLPRHSAVYTQQQTHEVHQPRGGADWCQ